jgi:coatomer protein complex subunit alpha (xenin)
MIGSGRLSLIPISIFLQQVSHTPILSFVLHQYYVQTTGHDNGLIVFKLERERPAFAVHSDTLYYIRDKYVRAYDFNTGSDIGLLSVRKFGSPYVPPRTLSFNPAERAVIVTITSDSGLFELTSLPASTESAAGEVKDSSLDGKKGSGQSAIFVARNRFAVLNKPGQVCISLQLIAYTFC